LNRFFALAVRLNLGFLDGSRRAVCLGFGSGVKSAFRNFSFDSHGYIAFKGEYFGAS